jgi:MFS family permease
MVSLFGYAFRYLGKEREHGLKTVYAALILLSFHWSLVVYVNSSYLGQFFSPSTVGALYTIGAIISLLPYVSMSRFLRRVGNYKLTVLLALLEIVAVLGMAVTPFPLLAVALFLIHLVAVPLLLFNIDILMETIIGAKEQQTGSSRGLFLALLSLSACIAPIVSGQLVNEGTQLPFAMVYIASAFLLIPFIAIFVLYFKSFKDPEYVTDRLSAVVSVLFSSKGIRNVFFVQLHLQFFFAWMQIYTPLYLAQSAGFSWIEIGYIIAFSQIAYVIFEYPIGIIADKYIGEKEMMAFGFFLIAVSTSWLSYLPAGAVIPWMITMFLTRVGASFIEATSESYFFKHTRGSDSHKISLFRMARPLGAIAAALLGTIVLVHTEFSFFFIILALLTVPGIFFTLILKDTK